MEHFFFFLTQPNLRVVDSFAGAVVGRRLVVVFSRSLVANTVLACFGFSLFCWVLFRARTLVGASARAMFTSPVGVESEALLQHVLTL